MSFPASPVNGQLATVNGITYVYNSANTAWLRQSTAANLANLTVSNTLTTGNIVPRANVTYSIGTPTQRFSSLYLSGNTIDLGGAVMKTDAASGAIAFIPNPTPTNPNPTGVVVTGNGAITSVTTTGGVLNANAISNATSSPPIGTPKVTTIVYPGVETAANTAGGETITLNGAGFASGLSI